MVSKVYFSENPEKIRDVIKLDGKIAVKVHFGEKGCTTYIPAEIVKSLCQNLKDYTLIETNTLYKGSRTITKDHINLAKEHGFTFAPIKILEDTEEIPVNLNHFKKLKIGKGLYDFNEFLIISHFKGHMMGGFGGAIKNLSMGLASRAGKLDMHAGISPEIDKSSCTECRTCINNCPVDAIDDNFIINKEICIGCAQCIAVCPSNAINIPWGIVTAEQLQERMAEYATVLKNKKVIYINILKNITKACDCNSRAQTPVIDDIGFLLSEDPVAIDKATNDLVNQKHKDLFEKHNGTSGLKQIDYAEEIGLGNQEYELIKL